MFQLKLLLMKAKGVRGGIRHALHRYLNANNNYLKDYNESTESSYLKY